MKLVQAIILLIFIDCDIDSIILKNTVQLEFDDLKQHISNVCSDFFKRSFCMWSSIVYSDLQTFILQQCYFFIPVLQYTSEEKIVNECQKSMIIDRGNFSVCQLILHNSVVQVISIVVLTNKSIDDFINKNSECSSLFDSMNFVVISLLNQEMRLLNTTVSSMNYLTPNGMIRKNIKLTIPNFERKLIKVATFHYPPFSLLLNRTGTSKYVNFFCNLDIYIYKVDSIIKQSDISNIIMRNVSSVYD